MRNLAWTAIVAVALGIAGFVLALVGHWDDDGSLVGLGGVVMGYGLIFATLSLRE